MAWLFIEYAKFDNETGENICLFQVGDAENPKYEP